MHWCRQYKVFGRSRKLYCILRLDNLIRLEVTVVDETAAEADAPEDTEADVEEADTVKTEGMQIILCEYRYCVLSDSHSISSVTEMVFASDSSVGYQAYGVECEIQFIYRHTNNMYAYH